MTDRLGRAAGVAVVMFAVVLAWMLGTRADQTTIAVLGGLVLGGLILVPAFAVATFAAIRLARMAERPTVIDHEPREVEAAWSEPAQLTAPRRVNVPVVMQRHAPIILTTTARRDGEVVELGADLDTLTRLVPLAGQRPPTRAAAREVGIVSNAQLAQALEWLSVHGWVTGGAQGVARQWTERATPTALSEWLDQFEPA